MLYGKGGMWLCATAWVEFLPNRSVTYHFLFRGIVEITSAACAGTIFQDND